MQGTCPGANLLRWTLKYLIGSSTVQSSQAVWALVRKQHGVIAHHQLVAHGFSPRAIRRRIEKGRLHPIWRSVYAVGRPQLTEYGRWMAAVLACGPEAALSHATAAALWEIGPNSNGPIHISIPAGFRPRHPGIVGHRRASFTDDDVTRHRGIPVTTPVCTLIDLAARGTRHELESAINEADKRDLVDPEALRNALDEVARRPGLGQLRQTLDRRTFTMTDTELERRFLPIAPKTGLDKPRDAGLGERLPG